MEMIGTKIDRRSKFYALFVDYDIITNGHSLHNNCLHTKCYIFLPQNFPRQRSSPPYITALHSKPNLQARYTAV